MTAGAVVELEGVGVRFGARRALAGVDLRVVPGDRVALVGPSGAGKSTLLSLLNGSQPPSEGVVRVLGRDLGRLGGGELRGVQRRIGTVHQRLHLAVALRVVHNVNAGRLGSWPLWRAALSLLWPGAAREAAEALGRVGLARRGRERTETLSGGEQQRVAIARLLVQRPAIVLADEPVANLDPPRATEILGLLFALDSAAVIVSLHDTRVALERFDRIVALRAGRVEFDASPADVSPGMLERLYALERV